MADFKLDHFKAYDLRETYQETVEIQDQFNEDWRPISLEERVRFLTPVKKNLIDIQDPTAHLTWYRIKDVSIKEIQITYLNQMTDDKPEKLNIDKLIGLLVPTRKHLLHGDFPDKLDHYTIYRAYPHVDVKKDIVLRDQFKMTAFSKATLSGFCAPCLKRREIDKDKKFDYHNPKDYLVIYSIPIDKLEKKIDTNNQFGEDQFIILRQVFLLVPTKKIEWAYLTE